MLTVKHVRSDGTEFLFEAERVEKVQTGNRFEDGIFIDRDDICHHTDGAVQPTRSHKKVIHFCDCASSEDVTTPMVYVMNRYGATVATYRL